MNMIIKLPYQKEIKQKLNVHYNSQLLEANDIGARLSQKID